MKALSCSSRSARVFLIGLVHIVLCHVILAQDNPPPGLFTPITPPRALYDISCDIEFDSSRAHVYGSETVTLANASSSPLEFLALNWTADSLQTLSITANGETAQAVPYDAESDSHNPIVLRLPKAVSPGQELEIRAEFGRTYSFEPGDDKHLWTNWYPRIDWGLQTQDDFIVKVANHSDFVLASSGRYDPETDAYRANGVRQFGLYFMKGAEVLKGSSAGVEVRIVHSPAASECAGLLMETALDAIAFYKEHFGFYPAEQLTVAQGVDAPNGGYPAATSLVVVHGMERMSERDELHWRWIMAHEIGHQYWIEHVMSKTPGQWGWLMIGLGIYMDREYVRYRGLASDKHLDLMSRFIDGVRSGVDTRADVNSDYLEDIDFDFNNVVVHGKGYSIISALDGYLGDRLFLRIHNRCQQDFAGRCMGDYDFQSICEQESGQDLGWFFDQWVRSSRFPAYEISSQECTPQNSGYLSDVTVTRTGTLDMPVPVVAYFADNTSQTRFTIRLQPVSTIHFKSAATLDSVMVDPNHEIAMVVPPPTADEIRIRKLLSSLPSRGTIDSLPAVVAEALHLNITQTLFWGRLGRQLYDWALYEDALSAFKRRTELLEKMNSDWVVSAYGWQGLLLDLLGRRAKALAAYKKALEISTDRRFSYDGDPVTISREWLEERLKTPYSNVKTD